MGKFLAHAAVRLELPETGLLDAVASVLGLLLGFAVILAAAYWVTRLVAGRQGGVLTGTRQGQPGMVEVLSRTPVGQDRFLLVVRTGGKVLLLGATPQSIQTLCELDPEQFPPAESLKTKTYNFPRRTLNFAEMLEGMKVHKKGPGTESRDDPGKEDGPDGES